MPKRMPRTVFLCGPMRGVPRHDAIAWRKRAQRLLGRGFRVLHAYRGREQRETFPDPRGAVVRDKQDIRRCDVMIVNDTFAQASMIGTAMEVFFAHALDKAVIVFGRGHRDDYWLNAHAHVRVDTLVDACTLVKKLFNV